jgi:enoyl-CoA hydratase/carnithine racemase
MAYIRVAKDGPILDIKVNRPEKLNALSPQMYHDIGRAYFELDNDPALRVAILHAEGRHFSSGVELDKWAGLFATGEAFPVGADEVDPFALSGPRRRKPVVMAVQGYCYTWGVEMMLNTDVRIAADDTKFAMLEVKRGIYPCGGATLRLPQQMGWANAQRYLLTGDAWSAQDALRFGLVNEVVPPGEQYQKAREIAGRIAKAAPLGVQAVLKSSHLAQVDGEAEAIRHLFKDMLPIMQSEDAKEGVQSFLDRRDAVFKGY